MSWNEPGGDDKDPWSGRNQRQGPPDIDEIIRSIQEKIGAIFGQGGSGGNHRGNGGGYDNPLGGLKYLIPVVLAIWVFSGFYIVDEGTRGVETQFGKYTETTLPGLNWHLPFPIEDAEIINIEKQRFFEVGYRSGGAGNRQESLGPVPREALMLTNDENIVNIKLAVQYRVKDAKDFLFNVYSPELALKEVTESAERGVIGNSNMDYVLTTGRSELVSNIKAEIQRIMDNYKSGIEVTSVNLQDAQPPEEVQGAFEDAIKAREDQQRFINEAQAYANEVVPKAQGAASRVLREAEAYGARVVAEAEGDAKRFQQLLVAYEKAPEITRKRLFIEAIESVLANTDTVMVDVEGGNNLLYLPIDKIQAQHHSDSSRSFSSSPNLSSTTSSKSSETSSGRRSSERGRTGRGR